MIKLRAEYIRISSPSDAILGQERQVADVPTINAFRERIYALIGEVIIHSRHTLP
jgi:hypothetical protein